MLDYYARRAPEYERIYAKPERQADLVWLKARVRELTRGARVLDLACGTGYWMAEMAQARSIVGADFNDTVLRIARGKGGRPHRSCGPTTMRCRSRPARST